MSTSTKEYPHTSFVCVHYTRKDVFMYSVISVVITDCTILFMASGHSYTEFMNIVIVVSTIMVINPGTQMARVLQVCCTLQRVGLSVHEYVLSFYKVIWVFFSSDPKTVAISS